MRSGGRRGRRQMMAEMNMTPFIDVMLVLLIVFMITAPLITQGVQVNLPEAESAVIAEQQEPIEVTIQGNGRAYIQSREVSDEELVERLKAIRAARNNADVMLRADAGVNYGRVMQVMSGLQAAGMNNVGLITQPIVAAP